MEPSYKTRKIIERWLLWLLLLALLGAGAAQFSSPLAQSLVRRDQSPVEVMVLTDPAMQFSYNPATQKAVVSVLADKKSSKTRPPKLPHPKDRFFIPQTTERDAFWNHFKHILSSWRYNPLLVWQMG